MSYNYDAFDDYDDFYDEDDFIDSDIDIEDLRNSVVTANAPDVQLNKGVIISETHEKNNEIVETPINDKPVENPVENVENNMELGELGSQAPEIPEDIVTYDIDMKEASGDYESVEVKVTKSFSEMRYPQLRINEAVMEHRYMVNSLKALLVSKSLTPIDDEMCFDVLITLEDGDIVRIGVMPSRNLSNFLSSPLFETVNKEIYLNENTPIRGDLMYALCTTGVVNDD